MNETEILLYSILSFAVGYYLAFIATNLGNIARKYGFFVVFVFPFVMGGLRFAEILAHMGSVVLSTAFALGFIVKIIKKVEK